MKIFFCVLIASIVFSNSSAQDAAANAPDTIPKVDFCSFTGYSQLRLVKNKTMLLASIASIVAMTLIIFSVIDMSNVISGTGDYSFGSDYFSRYSIYRSKRLYLFFQALLLRSQACRFFFAFKQRWGSFWIFFVASLLLIAYPIFVDT